AGGAAAAQVADALAGGLGGAVGAQGAVVVAGLLEALGLRDLRDGAGRRAGRRQPHQCDETLHLAIDARISTARSQAARSTSRWVTRRKRVAETAPKRRPASRARAARAGASCVS